MYRLWKAQHLPLLTLGVLPAWLRPEWGALGPFPEAEEEEEEGGWERSLELGVAILGRVGTFALGGVYRGEGALTLEAAGKEAPGKQSCKSEEPPGSGHRPACLGLRTGDCTNLFSQQGGSRDCATRKSGGLGIWTVPR